MNAADALGTARERDAWLAALRRRFVAIARRRVPAAAVEDVVQDALRIVIEKGGPDAGAAGALPHAFRVLRNVIGNFYQRERVRSRVRSDDGAIAHVADPAPTPLEALEARDREATIARALAAMAAADAACARVLSRLAAGEPPGDVARAEGVALAAFYRRVYRCRMKLRARLAAAEILA